MTSWAYTSAAQTVVSMMDDEGRQISTLATDPDVVAWVEAGNVIGAPPGPTWPGYQAQARAILADTDLTVLRCYEAAVPLPTAWQTYRKELRAIVGAASGDATQPLPAKPPYPAGT